MRRILTLALLIAVTAACGTEGADGNPEPPSTTVPPSVTSTSSPAPSQTTTQAPQPTDTTAVTPATDRAATTVTQEGDNTTEPTPTSSTSTTTTTTIPEPVLPPSPLTGLGVEDPELLTRRTMAVKVDNHWDARPQSGIGEAETVFELLVEGGLTRFIALYHTADPAAVGPVRSVRPHRSQPAQNTSTPPC